MAHAQKPEFVFPRNGWVHLNRWGRQFSRLLAVEECGSVVVMAVMLDRPRSEAKWNCTGYPLHSLFSPSLPLPCLTVCHQVPNELYTCLLSFPSARHSLKHFLYFVLGHPQRKGKGKDVPVHTMNSYGWVDVQFQSFLNPALNRSDWSAPRSGRFYLRDEEPIVPAIYEARWAPNQVWILWSREKSFTTTGNQTQMHLSARTLITRPTELSRIPYSKCNYIIMLHIFIPFLFSL